MGREAAKISALFSKDLLEKYEYLTGEDLWHRLSVLVKSKFEYSPLGAVLSNNVKKKTNTNKVNIKERKDKNLIYNSQYSFKKISMNVKNYNLTLCLKNWMIFKKDLISLKMLIHKQMKIKYWSQKF